jgi:phage tail tape-measure protein
VTVPIGTSVGILDGAAVGNRVGAMVGARLGEAVGNRVGTAVGLRVGLMVGAMVGSGSSKRQKAKEETWNHTAAWRTVLIEGQAPRAALIRIDDAIREDGDKRVA